MRKPQLSVLNYGAFFDTRDEALVLKEQAAMFREFALYVHQKCQEDMAKIRASTERISRIPFGNLPSDPWEVRPEDE